VNVLGFGYGRYVVSIRRADGIPVTKVRTDDLWEAEAERAISGEDVLIYDTEQQRYMEREAEP
jgi:hypothetical protein